ncbi:AbgT family transporter [Salinicoccus sp. RF5]|uniref:AbgT family transporter n=1 Tax=Salinicoccus sp. RF5 TaxID=2748874 RepID=UPI001E63278B|nr:AbgT family transporter [Salinicoccus sp. RF5]MCC4721996.1 AbgT family transporter [Salinicoccus sp. RF5]
MSEAKEESQNGILGKIERLGNRLPDPFFIFVILAAVVMVLSMIFNLTGATVDHPGTGETLEIRSLISFEGLAYMLSSMLDNFTGFAPLGLVLGIMLGIGVAEKTGLLSTAIRKSILKAPKSVVTYAIIVVGITGNLAADAAFVIIPPLAAMVFYTIGRHPLAGLSAGFAGTGAGFTANLIIAGTDATLAGITTEAAAMLDDAVIVTPVDNYYFMLTSVIFIAVAGGLITDKIIEPRLGTYKDETEEDRQLEEVSDIETKGLRNAVIAGVIFLAVIAGLVFFPGSTLRNEEGGLVPSPLLGNIVPIVLLFFVTIGVVYGRTVGTIEKMDDIPRFMTDAMKDMAGYIVLIFAAAQFIAYFNWSNLGTLLAVNSADFFTSIDMTGLPLILGFSVLTALLNMIIFSGSAQWALMAPVFIPMFMLLDYHPAFIQAAYRIADSSTNIITPLNPYIMLVLAVMKDYDKKAGLGTLISLMLPYSIAFFGIWIVLLAVFFIFGIPFGPGVGVSLEG